MGEGLPTEPFTPQSETFGELLARVRAALRRARTEPVAPEGEETCDGDYRVARQATSGRSGQQGATHFRSASHL